MIAVGSSPKPIDERHVYSLTRQHSHTSPAVQIFNSMVTNAIIFTRSRYDFSDVHIIVRRIEEQINGLGFRITDQGTIHLLKTVVTFERPMVNNIIAPPYKMYARARPLEEATKYCYIQNLPCYG